MTAAPAPRVLFHHEWHEYPLAPDECPYCAELERQRADERAEAAEADRIGAEVRASGYSASLGDRVVVAHPRSTFYGDAGVVEKIGRDEDGAVLVRVRTDVAAGKRGNRRAATVFGWALLPEGRTA